MAGVDNENLTDAGLWRQRIYMRNGLPLFESGETGATGFRKAFPQTVAVVEELLQCESRPMDSASGCPILYRQGANILSVA
jgi:hypothetical protein